MPVYVIRCGESGPVKIGFTTNFLARLRYYETHNPGPVTVLRYMGGTKEDEKRVHQRFGHLRVRSHPATEWFDFDPAMLGNLGLADLPVPETNAGNGIRRPFPAGHSEKMSRVKLNFYADPEKYAAYLRKVRERTENLPGIQSMEHLFTRTSRARIAMETGVPIQEVAAWTAIPVAHVDTVAALVRLPAKRLSPIIAEAA